MRDEIRGIRVPIHCSRIGNGRDRTRWLRRSWRDFPDRVPVIMGKCKGRASRGPRNA